MPKSLKVIFKKLSHDGKITEDEYKELVKKLDGHDKEVYDKGYNDALRDAVNAVNDFQTGVDKK